MLATLMIRVSAIAALSLAFAGCAPYPRDTADSSSRGAQFGLTVGASADPPYVVIGPDNTVSGSDAEIVERFARAHAFQVHWVVGGHDSLMAQLEDARLHLVIGGHAKDSPWEPKVGWSREIQTRERPPSPLVIRRFAMPPGENAWHVLLDRYLVAHESAR